LVFTDESKNLSLSQIESQNLWIPFASAHRGGFKKMTLWVKITVQNESRKSFFLYYNFPMLANFEVFQDTLHESSAHQMGSKFAQWDDDFGSSRFIVPLKRVPQEKNTIYLKLEHWGSIPLRLQILDETALLSKENQVSLVNGIFIGILILIVAYHFILFLITRYIYYLSYTLMVASVLLFNVFYLGYASTYLFSSSPMWLFCLYQLIIYCMFLMLAIFANHLLEFNHKIPKFWLGVKIILALYAGFKIAFLLSNPLSFQNSLSYSLIGAYHVLMLSVLFALIAGALYLSIVQKDFIAKLYLFAWTPIVITGLLFILEITGFIKEQEWLSYTIWISNSIEAVLFSQILGYKIRQNIEEKRQLTLDKHSLEKELEVRTQALKVQLYRDNLTMLKNRNALYEELYNHKMGVLILMDIFDFKSINDHFGIEVGNAVLVHCSEILNQQSAPASYNVYRLSSDLFALYLRCDSTIVMPHIVFAKELLSYMRANPFKTEGIDIDITCNIGIAISNTNLLEQAEIALHASKKGDEPIVVYEQSMDRMKQISMNLQKKQEIHKALDEDCFIPFFQPIVDGNGKVVKYEVLMRMIRIDEQGESVYIAPSGFFEYILRAKLYKQISINVIEKSFGYMYDKGIDFSINVNYQEIGSASFKEAFKVLLEKFGIGNHLIIEITESEQIDSYEVLQAFVEEVRHYGVKIAIDDFGSGFSNFENILKISPEYIKIDGSLIQNINHDEQSRQLVKSIISFAKEMHICTIAEFISEKALFDTAKHLGIDEYQGYYFGMPARSICTLN